MGSAVARLKHAGGSGLPPYVAVPHLRGGTDNLFHYAAYLGGYANPFVVESDPNDPKYHVKNLTLPRGVSLGRLQERRRVLEAMEQLRRDADPGIRDLDAYYQRAFDMLTGKQVASAFDVSAEPPIVRVSISPTSRQEMVIRPSPLSTSLTRARSSWNSAAPWKRFAALPRKSAGVGEAAAPCA